MRSLLCYCYQYHFGYISKKEYILNIGIILDCTLPNYDIEGVTVAI